MQTVGAMYGSTFEPVLPGSGGYGGAGGAALRLDAQTLILDGTINMDGATSTQGAGAGGSVDIRALFGARKPSGKNGQGR